MAASLFRPAMRVCNAAPAARMLSSKASPAAAAAFRAQTPLSRTTQSAFVRDALPSMRIAPFHASTSKAILPPLPQKIQGTANDPAPVPDPTPAHGSYHWSFERLISAALVPLTIAPFAAGSLHPVMDAVFCSLILVHSHIGFESIIIDYLPQKRVPGFRKLFMWGLKAGTILVAIGLYEFETNDVGVTEAVRRIWKA
ncbi:succinate dehydrogenase cytochrome b small subunit precursor [Saccharata proteae CBS 121410]|uniref:Succinate dehydrogenase [ubiquinone] cytochrome b small subunit n=1 Tax=Saccharata proteae CBS 121410 TaxID=1314787 RepID=A0A9P4I2I3_9PEZI|nr:succinate dehydrogenase cytochrome b small subunit precursor [Saccharata proteae CBS 121410]